MSAPLVSVVIPVRDGERYLRHAVESVLGQTCADLELIVVDDASTDGTAELVRGYDRELLALRLDEHAGPGVARNLGVRHARGSLLAFLDADDLWSPDRLERQLELCGRGEDPDLVFGHVRHFRSPELAPELTERIVCPTGSRPGLLHGTLLVAREVYERVGEFGTARHATDMLEWLMRADELGLRRAVVPDTILWRRLHDTNLHVRDRDARRQYAHALKESLDRRRAGVEA